MARRTGGFRRLARRGPPDGTDSIEGRARFGFAIFLDLASRAVENRLPMILDY
jgi:hypothetical protein